MKNVSNTGLSERLSQITYQIFFVLFCTLLIIVIGTIVLQQKVNRTDLVNGLTSGANDQIEKMLPTFLIEEQRLGLPKILSEIKSQESLVTAYVLDMDMLNEHISSRSCESTAKGFVCVSQDGKTLSSVLPIRDINREYGYLVKEKRVDLFVPATSYLLVFAVSVIFILFFIFLWLNAASSFLKKDLPREISLLLKWIELSFNESNVNSPDLMISELQGLSVGIKRIFSDYEQKKKQALLSNITNSLLHDLRAPLGALKTCLQLMDKQKEISVENSSLMQDIFSESRDRISLLLKEIENVLESGKELKVKRKFASISECINNSILVHKDVFTSKSVDVKLSVDCPDRVVSYDPGQLSRAVGNILKNAIESASFSDLKKVIISVSHMPTEVTVRVEDSGAGTHSTIEELCVPFGSNKVGGTGLGMFITKKIIEAHAGNLCLDSSPSLKGARFTIVMPSGLQVSES